MQVPFHIFDSADIFVVLDGSRQKCPFFLKAAQVRDGTAIATAAKRLGFFNAPYTKDKKWQEMI